MFVPPEDRHPNHPPWDAPPPRRGLPPRDETVLLWLIGMALVVVVLAPIAGSTVIEAVGYLLRR